MRQFFWKRLLGTGLLLLATGAWAQYRPDRDDPYERNDPYYRNGDPRRGGAGLIDRVMTDLDRARSYRRIDGHERRHFEQARRDLERFQADWYNGRWDNGRLDSAIGNIDHLVNSDQLSPRDREMLSRDLYALRDFRANRGYNRRGYGGYRY